MRRVRVCLRPDRISHPKRSDRNSSHPGPRIRHGPNGFRSTALFYRQPKITRAQFAYLAIYLVLIGNVAAEEARTERLFRGSDERLYNLQFGKIRLPDSEPAVVIYIEPLRPTTTARWKK